jgi:hypothetical protein
MFARESSTRQTVRYCPPADVAGRSDIRRLYELDPGRVELTVDVAKMLDRNDKDFNRRGAGLEVQDRPHHDIADIIAGRSTG